ncbi:hypothetical protein RCL1_006588 [Eukaryota sp. TZLM3-RCL]
MSSTLDQEVSDVFANPVSSADTRDRLSLVSLKYLEDLRLPIHSFIGHVTSDTKKFTPKLQCPCHFRTISNDMVSQTRLYSIDGLENLPVNAH